jgi:UDP-N-acetylglucosamine 3-dehydrogenase
VDKIGYGVIGCGRISKRHLNIIENGPGMRLAAIADRQVEHAQNTALGYASRPTVYEDYCALLDDPAVDVVVICLPSQLHAEATIAAAQARKHVYCEKIMATTIREAHAMIETARAADVKLMIGHNTRWFTPFAQARRIIESGQIGQIVDIDGAFSMQAFLPDTVRPTFWGIKAGARGHGKIMNFGSHYADTAAFLAGEQFGRISAFITNRFSRGQAPEDHFIVTAVCQSEATVTIAQYGQLHSIPLRNRGFVIYGTDGHLEAFYQPDSIAIRLAGEKSYRSVQPDDDLADVNPWQRLHEQFRQCIEEDTEPLVTGADGLRALEWAVGAYVAAETEQWVQLPLAEQWWDYSGPVMEESLPQARNW